MRTSLIILIIATTGLFSCGQGNKPNTDKADVGVETRELPNIIESHKSFSPPNEKYIDTRNAYSDSTGKQILIQNSLPKGGQKYTDPEGKDFRYAVFWTHIFNETDQAVELSIHFPADSFELASSADTYFKVFLPPDKMTTDKEPLFDYGLTGIGEFLDSGFHKPSSLQKTIDPKGSYTFYVLTVFNKGVDGVVRAGLSLKEQDAFYTINHKEIACGRIDFY